MITVAEALRQLFSLVSPLEPEAVPLARASGRVLRETVRAARDQPPFAASAMDGYAVPDADAAPDREFNVIGESAAGHGFDGKIDTGQAVRIFTGAPLPEGAARVIIQEDVARDGDRITLKQELDAGHHIRPAGGDFKAGAELTAPRRLQPQEVALLAAMNVPELQVTRKPDIALIATGDELVMPGEKPAPDQIIASNSFGLKAMLESVGAEVRMLPVARDTRESLEAVFDLARGADLVVTIGGASVGDHDIVADVAAGMGMEWHFNKVAMRPGKPLMAGKFGRSAIVGLPGNPVSSMVCGHVFLVPMVRAMLGLGAAPAPRLRAKLAAPLSVNGPREHYMRACIGPDGIQAFDKQDSSLLTILAQANALLVRPPHDPACETGDEVTYLPLYRTGF